MKKSLTEEVEDLTSELLNLMGVSATVELTEDKENQLINLKINPSDEAGLLIGYHGDTLSAIESFLALAIKQKSGEWVRIVVDIAGYKDKQEERLIELGKQAAQRAKVTQEPQYLYNLDPSQRRVIHLALGSDTEVETESVGEGEERYLVVKVKS